MAAAPVRLARPGDFEAVAALLTELGRTPLSDGTRPAFRTNYQARAGRADTADLVAEVDGRVVGFCSLEFRHRLNRIRPEAWIPDLVVTEGMRGRGIGRALLDEALALARERGCWTLVLESGRQREAAHRFYRSAGMDDSALHFATALRPDSV